MANALAEISVSFLPDGFTHERIYERESAGASFQESSTVTLDIASKIRQSISEDGKDPAATPLASSDR
ncbi:MAG TPA: hypothetical protein VGL59_12405 [Polyangia bacterium]|jgi:hypothetical protein